eukprot:7046970-Pyramimonas_sp.AAC.1
MFARLTSSLDGRGGISLVLRIWDCIAYVVFEPRTEAFWKLKLANALHSWCWSSWADCST